MFQLLKNKNIIYIVDLRKIAIEIQHNIDIQAKGTQQIIKRVIEDQVNSDFKNAEQQINDYIQQFQDEFDNLLTQRQAKEADAPKMLAMLEQQKADLIKYLTNISELRQSLETWKPH